MRTSNIISTTSQQTKIDNIMSPDEMNHSTVPPFIVRQETALASFRKAIGKDESFTDAHVEKFLRAMKFIESQRASYSFRDVVILSQDFLQIGSVELLQEMFSEYVSVQKKFLRLSEVEGCDGTIYVLQ